QSLPDESPGREFVRGAGAPQRREHVELPKLHLVLGADLSPGAVQMSAQPGYPTEHLHRRNVEIGAFTPPCLDQPVHLVPHGEIVAGLPCPSRLLTSRISMLLGNLVTVWR